MRPRKCNAPTDQQQSHKHQQVQRQGVDQAPLLRIALQGVYQLLRQLQVRRERNCKARHILLTP
jgi:hypothetical protein